MRLRAQTILLAAVGLVFSSAAPKACADNNPKDVSSATNAPILQQDVTREISIKKQYLNFPVKNGAPKRRVTLLEQDRTNDFFNIELADGAPDWWAFRDASPFMGKTVTIKVDELPEGSAGLTSIDQTAEIHDAETLYHEPLRPQFHFTSRRGWLNDPNGLVFYQGEYHLFYQHNPYGRKAANLSWGHAVSKDLVHWKELPLALHPDDLGEIYSGSAAVDWNNTAGFQSGSEPALVFMFTVSKKFFQDIAYSNDRGRTLTKYNGNPVLPHIAAANRDPKIVWFAPEKKWVMVLYMDHADFAFFSSPDLKQWTKLQDFTLPGDRECPNFFEIPLDGDAHNPRWIFYGASGVYVVGKFDGHVFVPETQPARLRNGGCWYAAQVFSDIPASDGRCIQIPWGRLPSDDIFCGESFNQMMGLPVELTLHSSTSGPRLEVKPVRELASLRGPAHVFEHQPITAEETSLPGLQGDLYEIEADITLGNADEITIDCRGFPVTYKVASKKIFCPGSQGELDPVDGKITLHLFIDRRSVDIFGGHGQLYLPMAATLSPENNSLKLSCKGGIGSVASLKVYELKSAWE